ncbi:MAG: acyl-CoA dehydratase activase-related protein, partial [Defluviitaleaceae bacterium]|nr:acyl-CoA dehydratase activase-related protein [Defluviitaleaceae bacterium]
NQGNPIKVVTDSLAEIYKQLNANSHIAQTCVTGYGENLIKAAIRADLGEIETVAHYRAAAEFEPNVDFILDIGGQDMKAIHVKNGIIENVLLNEACSAGCGSFIETFAKSMGHTTQDFAEIALLAKNPIDLGSRCTVFMNSRVKQAQKEGADVADIAAGLAYSVIKNALQKVIKVTDPSDLGKHAVVQGGTFLNDAVLRSFELISGIKAVRPPIAGLMGAYGAALIAQSHTRAATVPATAISGTLAVKTHTASSILTKEELGTLTIKTTMARCRKCTNNCLLTINNFSGGRHFISGNRCELGIVANGGKKTSDLPNLIDYKYNRLFNYKSLDKTKAKRGSVGIPRVLNIYENYPLWHTFFTELNYSVVLSPNSTRAVYEKGMESMPSESVCYPAKLAHGHIMELLESGVNFIFYPSVVYEQTEDEAAENCFNCPIVTSYPENIRLNVEEIRKDDVDFRNPFLTLDNKKALLAGLNKAFPDIRKHEIKAALDKALKEQDNYIRDVQKEGERALQYLKDTGKQGVVLAGRPYHADPEVHHGIPELILNHDVAVLTDDAIAHLWREKRRNIGITERLSVRNQWAYHARLYAAAAFVAGEDSLNLIQLNSFGCGLDAVTTDEVAEILSSAGKIYTCLKIDEVSNLGSARIRIRSLFAALNARADKTNIEDIHLKEHIPQKTPLFTKESKKNHTILCPQMSPIHFELIQEAFNTDGYNLHVLPAQDREAIDIGLRYVNNDACYPAIIVVGQVIKAILSGDFDTDNLSIIMTQTGGGCRASNYVGFIRRALKRAGYGHIPVLAASAQQFEVHPGFKLGLKLLHKLIKAVIYGDLLMRLSNATRPYETGPGAVNMLYSKWMAKMKESIKTGKRFRKNIRDAVHEFTELPLLDIKKPKVGIVGEILVKYHPMANNNLAELLVNEGAEAVIPDMLEFFLYSFYSSAYRNKHFIRSYPAQFVTNALVWFMEKYRAYPVKLLKKSGRFHAPLKIKDMAKMAEQIVSLGNQTGEGWFLTAEMAELIESGVKNILCAQPFACLPNHITGKGIIKELKRVWPDSNVVAVDYDPGASEVNQLNRIKLMLSVAKDNLSASR